MKKIYWVISGEGEVGTWERHEATADGIRKILTRERCGGDRWARAYANLRLTKFGDVAGDDVETDEEGFVTNEARSDVEVRNA